MKKEQQRIAIAKALGEINPRQTETGAFVASFVMYEGGKPIGFHGLPDYLNDLNAMHAAENVLNDDEHKSYRGWLVVVCNGRHWTATAKQRAEAFLRTLGLWEDEK